MLAGKLPITGRIFWSLIVSLLFALGGCATALNPKPTSNLAPKGGVEGGEWSGRLSLKVTADKPEKNTSFSASFELSGSADQGTWLLLSPLGSTVARLDWGPQGAVLLSNERGTEPGQGPGLAPRQFESIESLLSHTPVSGLPFAALFDWLQGKPTAVAGWRVDLSQFSSGKLRAQRLSAGFATLEPAIDLRLVLDR
jgi:outer membrane lipoprotein LolB